MKKILLVFVLFLLNLTTQAQENYSYNVKLRKQVPNPGQTLANICGYWKNGKEY